VGVSQALAYIDCLATADKAEEQKKRSMLSDNGAMAAQPSFATC